jgi:L,D-peptidoglycan transpeptidase YkuD (ErfK/YbiS/YcfS/YnhG family)
MQKRDMKKLRRAPRTFAVRLLSARATRGHIRLGMSTVPCAIGKGGVKAMKREGDGATPRGRLRVLSGFVRRDRRPSLVTRVPLRTIGRADGWCDAPNDRNYNRFVRHPYPASAEHLWRADRLYDLVLVLDANIAPRKRGCGSAIFAHVAREGFKPTEGCIALRWRDLVRLVGLMRRGDAFWVG